MQRIKVDHQDDDDHYTKEDEDDHCNCTRRAKVEYRDDQGDDLVIKIFNIIAITSIIIFKNITMIIIIRCRTTVGDSPDHKQTKLQFEVPPPLPPLFSKCKLGYCSHNIINVIIIILDIIISITDMTIIIIYLDTIPLWS